MDVVQRKCIYRFFFTLLFVFNFISCEEKITKPLLDENAFLNENSNETIKPTISFLSVPELESENEQANFVFKSNDLDSGVKHTECALDNRAYVICSSPVSYVVSEGRHELKIRAVDHANNVSESVAYTWNVTLINDDGDDGAADDKGDSSTEEEASNPPIGPNIVFFDGFESEDISSTNADGFKWHSMNRTSIVRDDNYVVYNNKPIMNGPFDKDWLAYSGRHTMRFRYPAGKAMAEQRFSLGKHYKDIWISYAIRVPLNYQHKAGNNKFLSLWTAVYDRPGTVTWQTRPNGSGGSNLVVQDGGVTNGEVQSTPFINIATDRGRWMKIVVHVKASSSSNANDGLIQLYRRWDGELNYTKIHEITNANTYDVTSSSQGIAKGYIFGWAKGAFSQNTEWLLDEFTVAGQSLLD